MSAIPLILSRYLHALVRQLDRSAIEPGSLLNDAGIPSWVIESDRCPVPAAAATRLLARHAGARAPEFAARAAIAECSPLVSPLVKAVRRSPRAQGAAVEFCALAQSQTSQTRFEVVEFDGASWLALHAAAEDSSRQILEPFWITLATGFLRQFAGRPWTPMRIASTHPVPDILRTLGPLRGCRVERQEGPTRILLDRWAARGSSSAPSERTPPLESSTAGACRHLVAAFLDFGACRLESLATLTGLPVRTLQRELAAAGTSFRELVDDVRMERSSELLRRPEARVTDVAMRLGYTDAAHFTRAFRRWYGVAPSTFRDGAAVAMAEAN